MWTQVRWRAPAVEGEAELLEDVHRLLTKAFPIEPDLPYPWRAWAEIVSFAGIDDAMARQVISRAASAPPDAVAIGYRRDPVWISHEGWGLEIPGDFAERRQPDEWWGGGAGRRITLAAVPTGPMSAQAFVSQFSARSRRRCADPPGRRARGAGADHDRPELRARDRRAGRLFGRHRIGRGDPHRVRRPGRLAVGARHVAVTPARVTGSAQTEPLTVERMTLV